jgi:hypothetical protein
MIDNELIFHNMSVNLNTYEWNGTTNIHYIPFDMLQFHSDWNWLMEAVEFIEKIDMSKFRVDICGKIVKIDTSNEEIVWTSTTFKKEAVFIAVSDFAKRYNNKEL